jgi:hypothetical protein
MKGGVSPIILVPVVAGILGLVAITLGYRMCPKSTHSRLGIALAALPSLVMLGLFYSLAAHMYHILGAWPTSIGERGFPSSLVAHAHAAEKYTYVWLLLSFVVWPVVFLLSLFVRRWRGCFYYLGVYALSFMVSFGVMSLAPAQFLTWWWD